MAAQEQQKDRMSNAITAPGRVQCEVGIVLGLWVLKII